VGPRAGLADVEKRKFLTLPGLELWSLGRPARSQLLYRLRYPGSQNCVLYSAKYSRLYQQCWFNRAWYTTMGCIIRARHRIDTLVSVPTSPRSDRLWAPPQCVLGVKWPERKALLQLPSIYNLWSCTFTPLIRQHGQVFLQIQPSQKITNVLYSTWPDVMPSHNTMKSYISVPHKISSLVVLPLLHMISWSKLISIKNNNCK
jgi:hypothetical protein